MRRALALLVLAMLAACGGAPLRAPEIPAADGYTTSPIDADATGEQRIAMGADIPAQWWSLYRSTALDALVREALDASPTIAQAAARLREARETLDGRTRASSLPKIDGKLSANRVDLEPEALGTQQLPVKLPLDLYLATVNVSYTFDFFGATRGELEALRARSDSARFELAAARQALAANVVTSVIRAASLRAQLERTGEALEWQSRQLAIAEALEKAGGLAQSDVASRREDLARSRTTVADLRRELEQVRHRLAIYLGRAPGAAEGTDVRLEELTLPAELPVSLPSQLVRQRPDILAAEALLREAGGHVGVATANLYPQVTLSAQLGSLSTNGSGLLSGGSGFSLLGAALTQPIFHGGELRAKQRAAVAAYDAAAAAYRDTVLRAFGNVADSLRAIEADASRLAELGAVVREARAQERIASARHDAGGMSELALLDARRKLDAALVEETRAIADRHADSAALLQAVGGGWWNEAPP
ncbi:MAG TPA: efflux transporter outer membrane subunit [Usitatibacter sp.]|nr:efflux transporter outer membrane subunit [Usitatibacter sp.]